MDVGLERRGSGGSRACALAWRVQPLPCRSEGAACGMEQSANAEWFISAAQRDCKWNVCLFHAFLPGAAAFLDCGGVRVRRWVFGGGGTGECIWRAVSPREVGQCGIENTRELLCRLRSWAIRC